MATKTISGIIKDAGDFIEDNCYIKINPLISLGSTYKGAAYIESTDSTGAYSIDVPFGNYDAFISYDFGKNYIRLGRIQVIDQTPQPVSLSVLLNNEQIPTNTQVLAAQAAAADAEEAANAALGTVLFGTEIAIGTGSGVGQGQSSVAIGDQSGATDQGQYCVAIGYQAGNLDQGTTDTGNPNQYSIAIGYQAGETSQSASAISIGPNTGTTAQGTGSLAIGKNSGNSSQGEQSVAVGWDSGNALQGLGSVAVGRSSGKTNQDTYSTAIGYLSGSLSQGTYSLAAGSSAGQNDQGEYSVSLGANAGLNNQGDYSVAIGYRSGFASQPVNSIHIKSDDSTTQPAATKSILIGASDYGVQIGDGNLQSVSDARDKFDIKESPLGLDFINALSPKFYKYDIRELYETVEEEYEGEGADRRLISSNVIRNERDGSKAGVRYHSGFIAQEVKQAMDDFGVDFGLFRDQEVKATDDHKDLARDKLSLCYQELIAIQAKAIQELSAKVDELTTRIDNL